MNLEGKRFVIFGLQGSGKTVLAKHILRQYPKHLVYDTLNEYHNFNRYIPSHRQYSAEAIAEINTVIKKLVIPRRPSIFVIDEANRFCPNRRPLPEQISKLNDFNRHYGIGFGVIARRPAQLHTDLTELAHYIFVFKLKGLNDIKYLNGLVYGLGDAVMNLEPYHFALVDENREVKICSPIPLR